MSVFNPTLEDLVFSSLLIVITLFGVQSFNLSKAVQVDARVLSANVQIQTEMTANERSVLDSVNRIRKLRGLEDLKLANELSTNAAKYSDHLASACGVLKHSDTNKFLGSNLSDATIVAYGENLAIHQSSLDIALQQLADSPSHNKIMTGDYTHIGISVVQSEQAACGHSIFIVEHFAKLSVL